MPLVDELVSLEKALRTGGAEAYRKHLAEECLLTFTIMAGLFTREQVLEMIAQTERWTDPEIEVQGLIQPKSEMVIFTYKARATRNGEGAYRALVSSGYILKGEEWKLVFHQQTPLPEL